MSILSNVRALGIRLIAAASLLCAPGLGQARTWHVERDGTGDFSVIQDAIDAASSGDTILIGPGRYSETSQVTLPGGTITAHGWIPLAELTFVGAGADVTVIGPTVPNHTRNFQGFMGDRNSSVHLQSLTVENVYDAAQIAGDRFSALDCTFRACLCGIDCMALAQTLVRQCRFVDNDTGIIVFGVLGSVGVEITDSQFHGNTVGIDLQTHGNFVRDCQYVGGVVGIQFSFGATGRIESCTFDGPQNYGVILVDGADANLLNCALAGSFANLAVYNSSHLAGSGNLLSGGSFAAITFLGSSTADFHGNHILRTQGLFVEANYLYSDPIYLDLRNNFWGTSSAAEISQWIQDGYDDPGDIGFGFVLFEPFAEQPVDSPVESFGGFKARFRREN